jgi:hypothetical protein
LHVSIGSITRSIAKKIKETINELIQDIWALFPTKLVNLTYFLTYIWIKLIFLICSFTLMRIIFYSIVGLY